MILEQQKAVGAQLSHVDQKVRELKRQMTDLMLRKNPDLSQQDLEKVFKRFDNSVVEGTLKAAQDKHESVGLASVLG